MFLTTQGACKGKVLGTHRITTNFSFFITEDSRNNTPRSKIQNIFFHWLYVIYPLLRHYNVSFLLLSYDFQDTLKHPKSLWGFPSINNRNIQCTSKAKLGESSQSYQALCNTKTGTFLGERELISKTDFMWELSWQHLSLLIRTQIKTRYPFPTQEVHWV